MAERQPVHPHSERPFLIEGAAPSIGFIANLWEWCLAHELARLGLGGADVEPSVRGGLVANVRGSDCSGGWLCAEATNYSSCQSGCAGIDTGHARAVRRSERGRPLVSRRLLKGR
jgi:hypothetical protein